MGAAPALMIPLGTATTAAANVGTEISAYMYAPSVVKITSAHETTSITFANGQSVDLDAQAFAAWQKTQQAADYYNGSTQPTGPSTQDYNERTGTCGKSWVQIEAKEWGNNWQSFWGIETWFGFSDSTTTVRFDDQWGTSHQSGGGRSTYNKRQWSYAGTSGGPGIVIMTMEPWSLAIDNVLGICYSYSPSTTTYVW